jgi:hypothetical protein
MLRFKSWKPGTFLPSSKRTGRRPLCWNTTQDLHRIGIPVPHVKSLSVVGADDDKRMAVRPISVVAAFRQNANRILHNLRNNFAFVVADDRIQINPVRRFFQTSTFPRLRF